MERPRTGEHMNVTTGCIFCQIVSGAASSFRVYEDDHVLAFMDLFPVTRGHTLVIPREHSENIFAISEASIVAVAAVSHRIARAIRKVLEPEGLAVYQANGTAAGQTIFHYHTHLIPRSAAEPFAFHGRTKGNAEELSALAEALKAAL